MSLRATTSWSRTCLLAGLQCFLLLLGGCQPVLTPLHPEAENTPPAAESRAELVTVATCRPGEALTRALCQAYLAKGHAQSEVSINVIVTNSSLIAEWVRQRQADIGILAVPGSAKSLATLGERYADLAPIPLATDAIAIIVHQDSPLEQVSAQDLGALYAGHIVDWGELRAGSGRPKLSGRERGAASRQVLTEVIMSGLPFASTTLLLPHAKAIVDQIARDPLAIGYASAACIDGRVKVVALDGVYPNPEHIRAGSYPLMQSLILISSVEAREMGETLAEPLSGQRGPRLLEEHHLLPADSGIPSSDPGVVPTLLTDRRVRPMARVDNGLVR